MVPYIKWFCEEFLGKQFEYKHLISIWITTHTKKYQNNNFKISYKLKQQKQMTIFDECLENIC